MKKLISGPSAFVELRNAVKELGGDAGKENFAVVMLGPENTPVREIVLADDITVFKGCLNVHGHYHSTPVSHGHEFYAVVEYPASPALNMKESTKFTDQTSKNA